MEAERVFFCLLVFLVVFLLLICYSTVPMLRYIGTNASVAQKELSLSAASSSEPITVGRDAKAQLRLDSVTAPRMISRLHATIKSQQSNQWLLTDEKSMNGVFVNSIKITSAILKHNDVITFGGLGQNIAMGAYFPQPNAEFIFRFELPQQQKQEASQTQVLLETTQPYDEDVEKTQILPASENGRHEEDLIDPTQVLPTSNPVFRNSSSTEMRDVDPSANIIVTTPSLTRRSSRARTQAAPVVPAGRTVSTAATQVLPTECSQTQILPPHSSASASVDMMDISSQPTPATRSSSRLRVPATAVMAATRVANSAVPMKVDPLGYRSPSTTIIDATMADPTYVSNALDLSQAVARSGSSAGSGSGNQTFSASLLDNFGAIGMATQTQVLPQEDAAAPASSVKKTPVKPGAAVKKTASSDLYDEEDDSPRASPAAASSASPAAAAVAGGSGKNNKRKRGRDSEEPQPAAAAAAVTAEVDDDSTPSKKVKRSNSSSASPDIDLSSSSSPPAAAARKPSTTRAPSSASTFSCPICSKPFPMAVLPAHVETCLKADSEAESLKLARKLEDDETVMAAAALAPKSKAAPAKKAAVPNIRKGRGRAGFAFAPDYEEERYEDEDEEFDEDYDEERYDEYDEEEEDAYPAPYVAPYVPPVAKAKSKGKKPPSGPKDTCPMCNKEFFQSELPEHADACEGPDEECSKCKKGFVPSTLAAHKAKCTGPLPQCPICKEDFERAVLDAHSARCLGKGSRPCAVCDQMMLGDEVSSHEEACMARAAMMSQDEKMAIEVGRSEQPSDLCNAMQLEAIQYVAEKAKKLSQAAQPGLTDRFKKLGFTEKDRDATLRYIRHAAPIIIHVNLTNVMKFFVADTHYRNQFETATSCGTLSTKARSDWENGLFGRIYHKASGYDRVKYGVLNIVQDPNGVSACRMYGDSYLLLKNDKVRLRTSFASRDTGGGTATLASCEWYAHVLMEYSDAELTDVITVATGRKRCVSSCNISSYKEVQFHGPIEFARDIEAIVVHSRHAGDKNIMDMVETFRKNNSVNVIQMEPDEPPAGAGLGSPWAGGGFLAFAGGIVGGAFGFGAAAAPKKGRRRW